MVEETGRIRCFRKKTDQVNIVLYPDHLYQNLSPGHDPNYPAGGPPPGYPAPAGLPPAATYGLPARPPQVYTMDQVERSEMAGFSEASVRRGFIRKVYGILLCQLTITGAIISCFMFVPEVKM